MKYIKTNEAIKDQIRKLGPGSRKKTKDLFLGRAIDDIEAKKLFEKMKKDFEEYNKDCRKIMIIDDYKVVYLFGEFHNVKNNPMTGNYPDDRYQKTYKVTFFKEKGIEPNRGRFEIEGIRPNPKHDPEHRVGAEKYLGQEKMTDEDREKVRAIDRYEDSFKISYDVAKGIYDYFRNEFIKQYPQLELSKYMNQGSIQTIEKGEKPSLGSVDVFDKNHNEIIYFYYDVNDKKKLEKFIKNHACYKGRNYKRHHITYFSLPNESEDLIRDNIINMEHDDVHKQNMERVYNYD